MKKIKSLRSRLIPIITSIAVIPIIIATTFSMIASSRLVSDKVNELTSQVAIEKSAYVDEYIEGAEKQTESLANLLSGLKDLSRDSIMYNIKSVKDSNESLLFGYMGTENKEMYIYPATNQAADYDPTSRQWYKDAAAAGGKFITTKPYKSASTGKYVVTVAKQIKLQDGRSAVVGLDVEIIKLMQSIAETKVGQTGHAILVTGDGMILAHPDSEMIMQNATEKFSWGKTLLDKKNGNINLEEGKERGIMGISQCKKSGWIVAAVLPEAEYNKGFKSLLNITIVLVLIVIAISIIAGLLMVGYITKPLTKLSELMGKAESGDFSIEVETNRQDEIGQIQSSFKNLLGSQKNIISKIMSSSGEILDYSKKVADISEISSDAIGNINSSVEEIAASSQHNAAGIEEANAGIEEMSASSQLVASSAQNVKEYSEKSLGLAREGFEQVEMASGSMLKIKTSTKDINAVVNELYNASMEIDTIVKTITSIASQTNLLALNAAIEAARAGESGRGFAVVADEVRKLAEESSSSAKNIEKLIQDIQSRVEIAVKTTEEEVSFVEEGEENTIRVKNALKEILESIKLVDSHIEDVAAASEEQSASSQEMAAVIGNISVSIEENVRSTEEVSSAVQRQNSGIKELEGASKRLEELARELSEEMERFKI